MLTLKICLQIQGGGNILKRLVKIVKQNSQGELSFPNLQKITFH